MTGATRNLAKLRGVVAGSTLPSHGQGGFLVPRETWGGLIERVMKEGE